MLEIFNTVFKYKEKQSPDQLGFYPERVHVNAMPERRYLWTSRVLVILACLSICLNMMLAATIYLLLPQRTVQPKLFQINKYFSMLEQVQPAEINFPVSDLITEQHITEYILLRYLVSSDYDELVTRWGPGSTIYWYSSPAVFREFSENDVAYSIMQFRQKSLQRDVEIDWIKPAALGLWQVQFRTMDYLPGSDKPTTSIWRATMRITYVRIPFAKREDAIANPFGFLVQNFSLAYHGSSESSAHYLERVKQETHTDAIMRRGGSKDLSAFLCQGHCLQTKKSPSCEGLGLFAEDFFIQAFQFVDIMRNQPQPFIPESRVIRIQSERFEQFIIIGYGRF